MSCLFEADNLLLKKKIIFGENRPGSEEAAEALKLKE